MSWVITGSEKTPVDPQFGSVSLLLHGDGANGSTTITDSSPTPKTVTAVGNAQISTAQSKFGGASIAFDGSNSQVSIGSSSQFGFGLADFTIEMFAYSTASGVQVLFDMRGVGTAEAVPTVYLNGTTLSYFVNNADRITASSAFVANTWQHIAVSRVSGATRLFVNGIQVGSTFSDNTAYLNAPPVRIGSYFNIPTSLTLNGYIDDFRITKGVARYTANFTPPTAAFPDI